MSMGIRILGRSGIRVSRMCLGTMTFGTDWGWGADEDQARSIYTAYREAGGNFVDTANVYTNGTSEEMVGRFVAGERDRIVLASKFTFPTDTTDANSGGSHRKSLRQSVETSLRRLGTDHLDVLWVHAHDQATPVEEIMRALDDLVRAGKVLAIGVSNTPAWVAARADTIAELRGWTTFCGMQVPYSLAERAVERELLPLAHDRGMLALAWGPLGRGRLTGKHDPATLSPAERGAVDAVAEVAQAVGATPAQVALAWVLHRGLVPVLGARTPEQITDNLGAADVRLDDTHLARLDVATRIELGYPHDWLNAPHRRAAFNREVIEGSSPGVVGGS